MQACRVQAPQASPDALPSLKDASDEACDPTLTHSAAAEVVPLRRATESQLTNVQLASVDGLHGLLRMERPHLFLGRPPCCSQAAEGAVPASTAKQGAVYCTQ